MAAYLREYGITFCSSLSFAGITRFRFRGSSRHCGNSQAVMPPLGYLKYTAIKEMVSSATKATASNPVGTLSAQNDQQKTDEHHYSADGPFSDLCFFE